MIPPDPNERQSLLNRAKMPLFLINADCFNAMIMTMTDIDAVVYMSSSVQF